MATYAIGDIHGNRRALASLLDTLSGVVTADDRLVFLGDTIDRGPDSKGVIDAILALRSEASFEVAALLGNHEAWMLATLDDYTRHSWLLGGGAFPTIESYSSSAALALRGAVDDAGPRLITEDIPLPYEEFFESMPDAHQALFRGLELYLENEDGLFVHAGIDPEGGAVEQQNERELIWGFAPGFPEHYRGPKPVVYGHRSDVELDARGWPRPRVSNGVAFGIDSIHTGVLTAIRMPGGDVFQSERFLVEGASD